LLAPEDLSSPGCFYLGEQQGSKRHFCPILKTHRKLHDFLHLFFQFFFLFFFFLTFFSFFRLFFQKIAFFFCPTLDFSSKTRLPKIPPHKTTPIFSPKTRDPKNPLTPIFHHNSQSAIEN